MKSSRLLSGLGAVAMAIVPVAAQAGTRASDAGAINVQPVAMSGVERGTETVTTKSELNGSATIIAIVALIALIAGIAAASGDDSTD